MSKALISFEVYPDGSAMYPLAGTSKDVGLWERTLGKGRTLKALLESMQVSWLEEVAHLAAVREGRYEGNLGGFRELHSIVPVPEDEDGDEDEGPTRSGR